MDQYLDQIDNIIKDEKTSSIMCLKLKEILDLRQVTIVAGRLIRIWKDIFFFRCLLLCFLQLYI